MTASVTLPMGGAQADAACVCPTSLPVGQIVLPHAIQTTGTYQHPDFVTNLGGAASAQSVVPLSACPLGSSNAKPNSGALSSAGSPACPARHYWHNYQKQRAQSEGRRRNTMQTCTVSSGGRRVATTRGLKGLHAGAPVGEDCCPPVMAHVTLSPPMMTVPADR
eukprot:CAMPEP_0174304146 /NCGR_PEP_ID=MMETSP0809-20121228/60602_1 /TAXON_ID=73025 ORGANISM="Eutreptiella gymnastica-like, Strain CCMP1594" /NCGR_SAMPLE_ID=MMETSP0809 /ASSEMBLY_ACC=CAM_ASM_000658 /LENGTH=163 /DNA_ID=CAMNT_0015410297 /DNA_START=327 /DNA_END=819 /DNA_ORIENTATION=-